MARLLYNLFKAKSTYMRPSKLYTLIIIAFVSLAALTFASCSDDDDDDDVAAETDTSSSSFIYNGEAATLTGYSYFYGISDYKLWLFFFTIKTDSTSVSPMVVLNDNKMTLKSFEVDTPLDESALHIAMLGTGVLSDTTYTSKWLSSTWLDDIQGNTTTILSGSITPVETGYVDINEDTASRYYKLQFDDFSFTTSSNTDETFSLDGVVTIVYDNIYYY